MIAGRILSRLKDHVARVAARFKAKPKPRPSYVVEIGDKEDWGAINRQRYMAERWRRNREEEE